MSCFVIDKKSYIQAAGFVAGLADCSYCRESAVFLYDYSRQRRYTPEDFRLAFDWLYRLNVKSVRGSHRNSKLEPDSNEYLPEFRQCRKKGLEIYSFKPDELQKQVARLNNFLQSVIYQLDDPECERQAKGFIYRLMFALSRTVSNRVYDDEEIDTWGEFEII